MPYILSISTGLNLLMIILTIRVLKNNIANIFLLALLCIVLIGTSYVISLNYFTLSIPLLKYIINSLPTLVGGLTYLYVYYSINPYKKIRPNILIHFLPLFVAIPLNYYDVKSISYVSIILNIGLKIIVSIVYIVFSLKLLNQHKINIQNHFSKIENIDLKWLSFIVKVGLLSYLIYFITMVLWAINIEMLANLENYVNSITLFFIFSISYYSISSTKIFEQILKSRTEINMNLQSDLENEKNNTFVDENEKKELISKEEASIILQKIIVLIETKELFKNENLMLEDLARELDLHSKYLSYVINTISGKNFFDFINQFRIKKFNSEVLNPQNKKLTFLAIAFECGFGSKSAFNRAYKSKMGISPTEFLKKNKNP
jgi:AraC-like DNA-binding protein